MFEYLMPRLLLRSLPGTLLAEACRTAVARQIEYGRELGVPWGISESGFAAQYLDGDYQYQSFGVPGLGLKRGLDQDRVVAPYATAMAAMLAPREALENFRRLAQEGAEGDYGFYEAIDYTPDRVPKGQRSVVVQSYMAHHQGMSLVGAGQRAARRRRCRAGSTPSRWSGPSTCCCRSGCPATRRSSSRPTEPRPPGSATGAGRPRTRRTAARR